MGVEKVFKLKDSFSLSYCNNLFDYEIRVKEDIPTLISLIKSYLSENILIC